jgi:hypothetical protein
MRVRMRMRVWVPLNGPSVLFQAPLPIALLALSGNAMLLPIPLWLPVPLFRPLAHVASQFCPSLPHAASCLVLPALPFVLGPK